MTDTMNHRKIRISEFQAKTGRFAARHPKLLVKMGNLESRIAADHIEAMPVDRPIYVAGLARSGTTILLEHLAEHEGIVTHRYRDFPFVHVPLWWDKFIRRAALNNEEPVQRFHQDRIRVTSDSPEAMEEILWMAFFKNAHNPEVSSIIGPENDCPLFNRFYETHIQKLLFMRQGRRYAAKNNYNINRLAYLQSLFAGARFIIMVREPVEQVASLIRQHELMCVQEKKDSRVLEYMRQSGHFEFGLDRRPINTGPSTQDVCRLWSRGEEIRGWARYWASIYQFVFELLEENDVLRRMCLVLHYDDLCMQSVRILRHLYDHCELNVKKETILRQSEHLQKTGYYQCHFTREERQIIEEETERVHRRISRLCPK
jgi:hypothetical protein